MKKRFFKSLGTFFICCLASTHLSADQGVQNTTIVEKGLLSKIASLYSPRAKTHPFTPAYATLVYKGPSLLISTQEIDIPLDSIQVAKEITLDADADTFTLPKGVYSIRFQLTFKADTTVEADAQDALRFTDIFLEFNNDASKVLLDWGIKLNNNRKGSGIGSEPDAHWAFVSGSKVFSVGSDNTIVKCKAVRESSSTDIVLVSTLQGGGFAQNNNSVRISLHKINGCS